ncbi:MAG: SprT family protein [Bacilli bacterium]
MTDKQLQVWVECISEQDFGKPFRHKAYFNDRLRTTGGRYMLRTGAIEINPHYYEQYGETDTIGVIRHELCHYHLHQEGKGYQHRDQDFRMLLSRVGAPRFCKSMPSRQASVVYHYVCTTCTTKFIRKRRMNTARYRCGKCMGEIELVASVE